MKFIGSVFLVIILLQSQHVNGQFQKLLDGRTIDTNYVQLVPGFWSIRAFGSYKFHNVQFKNSTGDFVKYSYPNSWYTGLGFAYKFIIVDAGISLSEYEDEGIDKFNLSGNLVLDNDYITAVFMKHQGLQQTSSLQEVSVLRPDVSTTMASLQYTHVVNGERLSWRSSFTGDQIQRRSTASILWGAYFTWDKLDADSSVIPLSAEYDFAEFIPYNFQSYSLGAKLGAAFNLVIAKGLLWQNSLNPGVGIAYQLNEDTNALLVKEFYPEMHLSALSAISYINNKWYTTFSYENDVFLSRLANESNYQYRYGQVKLTLGYRFGGKMPIISDLEEIIIPHKE